MLLREVQAEHPTVRQLGLSQLVQPAADSLRADTTLVVAVRTARPLPAAEAQHLTHWLEVRERRHVGQVPLRVAHEGQADSSSKER